MRRFDSTAYDLVHSLEDLLPTMNINNDVYTTPFISTPYINPENEAEDVLEMFDFEDIAFVNT